MTTPDTRAKELAGLTKVLREVRSLIDTPEKYAVLGLANAIDRAASSRTQANAMIDAVRRARGFVPTDWSSHASALARLDRAIAGENPRKGARLDAEYQRKYYETVTKPKRARARAPAALAEQPK